MADAISIQELIDARTDAKTLEEAVNGDAVTTVLSRLGETYPTLSNALNQIDSKLDSADTQIKQGITSLFENGGLPATPFATKALMTASALVDGKYAMVTDDTINNGLYIKTAGAWVKSSYDPLTQAKSYTDAAKSSAISTAAGDATTKANTAKTEAIADAALDATEKANAVKSYTDSIISAIDFGTPIMTGQAIYDKAATTNERFTAIWSEYNKPVWHIGDSVFVDAVGATVKVVKQEFVMTYKLTQANQTVRVPLVSKDGVTAYVDWGDGTAHYIDRTANMHTYTNAIGDEFVITITGELEVFNVPQLYEGDRTAECIKSIDKNTLPKTTTSFNLRDCKNLVYLCDGAFSSLSGTALNLELYKNAPNVTYSNNLFSGLQNVKNIDNLFVVAGTDITGITYSPELFKYFTGITSAKELFRGYKGTISKNHLKAMTELQYAYRMLSSIDGVIDSDVLTNQTKLIDVNQCFFSSKSTTTSALPIYQHLLNNNPNLTNHVECFKFTTMLDAASIPAEWK